MMLGFYVLTFGTEGYVFGTVLLIGTVEVIASVGVFTWAYFAVVLPKCWNCLSCSQCG